MFTAERAVERYRAARRKITPQRIAVFRALEGNITHPSAEDIYERVARDVPGISRATVYNTLETLQELGEVREFHFRGDYRQYDPNTDSHHHCLCTSCGGVRDVAIGDVGRVRLASRGTRFDVTSFSVTFFGRCPSCRNRAPERTGTHTGKPRTVLTVPRPSGSGRRRSAR